MSKKINATDEEMTLYNDAITKNVESLNAMYVLICLQNVILHSI